MNTIQMGKLPTDGLAYEDVESISFGPFTTEDLQNIFGSEEYRRQLHDGELARHFLPLILPIAAVVVKRLRDCLRVK